MNIADHVHLSDIPLKELAYPVEKPSPEMSKVIASSSRIRFESFSLMEDGVARLPNEEETNLIFSAFPTATAVGVYPPMVVIRFQHLPPKPWPLTVAGLPAFLTTDE